MKLCLVYNPRDSKLRSGAYCSVFKDMFRALIERFDCWYFVTKDCSAEDIDADLIFFFDPHATHHVKIDGVKNHRAMKMEYWNDLHQKEVRGVSKTTGEKVHKLGAEQRVKRAKERGVSRIVSPVKYFFHERFGEYFDSKTLLYFPHAVNLDGFNPKPYGDRERVVLGNGATWGGWNNGYDFRKWVFDLPDVKVVEHWVNDKNTPSGKDFLSMLSEHMGALALCTPFPVPKYFEVPAAGCVTFAEHHLEYEELGFRDYESCIYINKANAEKKIADFLRHPQDFDSIAKAGREIITENYTAKHFAEAIHECVRA